MDELKQEKKDTEGRVNTLKRKFREIKSTCSTLAAEPTDKELASILPELRKEVGDMDAQIEVTLFFNLPSTISHTHTHSNNRHTKQKVKSLIHQRKKRW